MRKITLRITEKDYELAFSRSQALNQSINAFFVGLLHKGDGINAKSDGTYLKNDGTSDGINAKSDGTYLKNDGTSDGINAKSDGTYLKNDGTSDGINAKSAVICLEARLAQVEQRLTQIEAASTSISKIQKHANMSDCERFEQRFESHSVNLPWRIPGQGSLNNLVRNVFPTLIRSG
jgi:hypothetical protein